MYLIETFNWIDGTDNPFENWNSGEPSGSWGHETENCAEMLDTGKFNDVNCDNYLKAYGCYTPECKWISRREREREREREYINLTCYDFRCQKLQRSLPRLIEVNIAVTRLGSGNAISFIFQHLILPLPPKVLALL